MSINFPRPSGKATAIGAGITAVLAGLTIITAVRLRQQIPADVRMRYRRLDDLIGKALSGEELTVDEKRLVELLRTVEPPFRTPITVDENGLHFSWLEVLRIKLRSIIDSPDEDFLTAMEDYLSRLEEAAARAGLDIPREIGD